MPVPCRLCTRPLRSPTSVMVGVGPVCLKRQRTQLRELLGTLRQESVLSNLIRGGRTTQEAVQRVQALAGHTSASTFGATVNSEQRQLFYQLYGLSNQEMHDLSDRIVRTMYQERRRQVRPTAESITLPTWSSTRRRMEDTSVEWVTENTAIVGSQGGEHYAVTEQTCTCAHYHNRVRRHPEQYPDGCRHIHALRGAQHVLGLDDVNHQEEAEPLSSTESAVENVRPVEEAPAIEPPVIVQRTRPLFVSSQLTDDSQREEILNTWRETRAWDGTWMQTDDEAYNRLMEEVEGDFDPVVDGTALGGTGNMFGVEIEMEFPHGNWDDVTRELARLGLVPPHQETRQGYHARQTPGLWVGTSDSSLIRGLEMVAPILHDTPEHWEQVKKVLEVAKQHGAVVNERTGCHTNINLGPTDSRSFAFQRLARAAAGHEQILYRMGGANSETFRQSHTPGVHRSSRGSGYVSPMAANIRIGENTPMSTIRSQISNAGHSSILNMTHEGRVEFRYPNSTLDIQQMQAQIIVTNAMVHQAAVLKKSMPQDGTTPKLSELSQQLRHPNTYRSISPSEITEEQAFRRFLDFLGTPLERKAAAWLYKRGSI